MRFLRRSDTALNAWPGVGATIRGDDVCVARIRRWIGGRPAAPREVDARPVRTYDTDAQQAFGTRERSKGRMTKTRPAVALLVTLLSIGAVLVPQGCATRGSPADAAAQDQEFMGWLQNVSNAAKADPKYKNLSIDSPQQIQSFMVRTHDAYRRKISVEEYTRWLNASYPGHEYEVSFITQRLPR